MKKNYLKKLLLMIVIGLVSFSFHSCDNSQDIPRNIKEENITKSNKDVRFMTMGELLKCPELSKQNNGLRSSSGINIAIVSIELGRKDANGICRPGFGICSIKWFPQLTRFIEWVGDLFYAYGSPVYIDGDGYYLIMALSQPADLNSFDFNEKDFTLEINKDINFDIEIDDKRLGNNKQGTIARKKYILDRNIGPYGGYRIPIKIHQKDSYIY